jgi:hypothetical protein
MQVNSIVAKVLIVRHSLARKFTKPIVMLETVSHSGYCWIVWQEGHELLSVCALGMLVAILTNVAIGAE